MLSGYQLNGSETYAMILPYFTTNEMTPMDVHTLGKEQLKMLYPQVSTIWFKVALSELILMNTRGRHKYWTTLNSRNLEPSR